jgi:hypothetical protein
MGQIYTISSSSKNRERTAIEYRTTVPATYRNAGKESAVFLISVNCYTGTILKIGPKLEQCSIIDETGQLSKK